jgi:hypothetical protein
MFQIFCIFSIGAYVLPSELWVIGCFMMMPRDVCAAVFVSVFSGMLYFVACVAV